MISPLRLVLGDTQHSGLADLARRHRPYEACGMLVCVRHGMWVVAQTMVACRNGARDRAGGFRLAAADIEATRAQWAKRPDHLIAVFHSHGLGPADPSPVDLAMMRRRSGLYLIVVPSGVCRAFASCAGRVVAVPIRVGPSRERAPRTNMP